MALAIALSEIRVPDNRQRSYFDDRAIAELAESMAEIGQIQAITVRRNGSGYILMTGERRLRARTICKDHSIRCGQLPLHAGEIAAEVWDDLPEYLRYQVELDENIRRADLTWQEKVSAINRLYELRKAQEATRDRRYTKADLATEARLPSGPVQANVILSVAAHLADPEVSKALNLKEAVKVVERKLKREQLGKLAAAFESQAAKETPHRLLRGDCFELYKNLEPNSFDVLLTDPPYGIGADGFGSQAQTGHAYLDSTEQFEHICWNLPEIASFVLRPSAHVYVFHDIRYFAELKAGFAAEGFDVWETPLIWVKGGGMLPKPDLGPRRTYEAILFANRGGKRTELIGPDALQHSLVTEKEHGAQKPVSLYRDLLARSTRPGNRVLDPFCGSGTIFPAATEASCAAVGIELDPAYADIAAKRMIEGRAKGLLDSL